MTRRNKEGELTGAKGALLPLKIAPQGRNESPALLPFTSFYSPAKQVLVSAPRAALPNTGSSLLAPEQRAVNRCGLISTIALVYVCFYG